MYAHHVYVQYNVTFYATPQFFALDKAGKTFQLRFCSINESPNASVDL